MITKEGFSKSTRDVRQLTLMADLVISGGGLSGVCAAITAARQGIKIILVQDRPVLGGNASSEVRLWILGATSHMGNNNRWAREGGVIDEILVENLYRNKDGNPLILDTILLEKITNESNITLLLNTSVYDLNKSSDTVIESIMAFCSQNATRYKISAPLFCDASGDGILGFKAGASFRIGAESKHEFGELFAPDKGYGELLGHSLYFYSKRVGHPVKYVPPAFALKDIKEIPRYKVINRDDSGCRFWWLEYGGRLDTIHETEKIKWELWKVVYGVWDYIKNSGEFEDVDDLTLEWVGTIPGKRESRRFEGLYMMKQQDVIEQKEFEDAVSFGGWALDLHPADGLYSELPGCTQWHTKGVYQIPYRSMVSKDIENLFITGRLISASHVAFGSTRVMATCAINAQAVGMAAAICAKKDLMPADLLETSHMKELQNLLNLHGQSIPHIPIDSFDNLASQTSLNVSSELILSEIPSDGTWYRLSTGVAQLLPLAKGNAYQFGASVSADETTSLTIEMRLSSKKHNYTPDVVFETIKKTLQPGEQQLTVQFTKAIPDDQYAFVTFLKNDKVQIAQSSKRFTGILSVYKGVNKAVSNNGKQAPPEGIGIDTFEFWIPYRRPSGKNLALTIKPALNCFGPENLTNGFVRPWLKPNAWLGDPADPQPEISLTWDKPTKISSILLYFDADYDHPMESVLMGHPEDVIPFCVNKVSIYDGNMNLLHTINDNHQTRVQCTLVEPVTSNRLIIRPEHPNIIAPVSIFQIIIQ